jgi:hypothetical protein
MRIFLVVKTPSLFSVCFASLSVLCIKMSKICKKRKAEKLLMRRKQEHARERAPYLPAHDYPASREF